jgi:DNA-3-methyladenine glycosylase
MRLDKNFYRQDAVSLAKDLLGKLLVREYNGIRMVAKIVETEAYMGPIDKASHAYNNRKTSRTVTMFKDGGYSYVYFIYGMYNCLNVVCSDEGTPEAVLIRAVEPLEGIEHMKEHRTIKSKRVEDITNGPGKLCKAMNIDRGLNGCDLIAGKELYIVAETENVVTVNTVEYKEQYLNEEFSLIKATNKNFEIIATRRIGIDYAEEFKEQFWRFYIRGNKFVSKDAEKIKKRPV